MRKIYFPLFFLLPILFFSLSSCSWLPSSSSEKENPKQEEGSCEMEGYVFLRGKAPNQLPVLQNETGQWRLTGPGLKQTEKFQRKKVRVLGECPDVPQDQTWLLPEIQVFSLILLEEK